MKEFYVYLLRAANEELPFYVGKGHGKRIQEHVRQAKRGKRSPKCAKIRKLLRLGIPIIHEVVFESTNEQECFEKEMAKIKKYGRRDIGAGTLTNLTDGGEGSSGVFVSDETRAKKSASLTGRVRSKEHCSNIAKSKMGHPVTVETRAKLRKANLGRCHPPEVVEKIAAKNQGKKRSQETRRRLSEISKGRVISQVQREAISRALKGRTRPESVVDKGAKYTREEAARHIKAQISSGLMQKTYCELHGIKEQTFCGWKRSPYVIARFLEEGIDIPRRLTSRRCS